jgi:hypothetical protein
MKLYKVGIYEEQGGYFIIKAKSQKEAEKIIYNKVNGAGIDEISKKYDFDIKHREVDIVG